jgi:hypothetical protein
MIIKTKHIKNIDGLLAYKRLIGFQIIKSDGDIKNKLKAVSTAGLSRLSKNLGKSRIEKTLEAVNDPFRKLIPQTITTLLKKTVFKKAGLIPRMLLSIFSRKLVKSVILLKKRKGK